MPPRLAPALAALASATCATQYDPCFLPGSLVSSLRVLAVRVEPPEALFDPVTLAVPPVSVTALVVHPDEAFGPLQLRARACAPPEEGKNCPSSSQWTPIVRGAQDALPEIRLGIEPATIRAARDDDPLGGYGGIRVRIEVEARGPGSPAAVATKLLILSEDRPGATPNHGLEIAGARVVRRDGATSVVSPGEAFQMNVGDSVGLSPLVAPAQGAQDAAEEYEVVDLSGRRVRLRERISYSFYVTPHAQYGAIGRPEAGADVADEPPLGEPPPPGGLVKLSALADAPARAFVVARDGRGGEAWAALPFTMTDQRACMRGGIATRCASLEIGCE